MHAAGTREIDRLGGLARNLPWSAAFFTLGAVAICGLPPLNGFMSEFILYLGALRGLQAEGAWMATFIVPVLALVGTLAGACFVKVVGTVFLGLPRANGVTAGHECGWSMRAPMLVLAALCVALGVAPALAVRALDAAAGAWIGAWTSTLPAIDTVVPFKSIAIPVVAVAIAAGTLCMLLMGAARGTRTVGTWDCGYLEPAPRMQYTGSSLGNGLVRIFQFVLHPRAEEPVIRDATPCTSCLPDACGRRRLGTVGDARGALVRGSVQPNPASAIGPHSDLHHICCRSDAGAPASGAASRPSLAEDRDQVSGMLAAILAAAALMGASGILCALLPRRLDRRDTLGAVLMVAGGGTGAVSALLCLMTGTEAAYDTAWLLPLGRLALRLDMLSAVFLVPVFLVPALGAAFGAAYWRERDNPVTAPRLRLFYGLLPAGIVGVILAQNGVLLLIAWEIMALAAFFAIAAEDTKHEVRDAAWVYFVATHLGTLALLGFFTLLSSATGSYDLLPLAPGAQAVANGLFVLGLVGFGLKAGIMPLHVWLPGAHANAPSHVSAILSGVMLKVGVYGLFRVCWLLAPGPLWWSYVLIGLGACSAVLGIVFALGQRDYKRLLAYSSIENIGFVVLALGVAMLGRTTGSATLTTLGVAAALVHVQSLGLQIAALLRIGSLAACLWYEA